MTDKTPKGTRMIYQAERDALQAAYAKKMAEQVKSMRHEKHPMGDTQPESTRILMSMPVDQPFISNINPIADHPDKVQRPITYDEFMAYKEMQVAPKNTAGESTLSSQGQETLERAESAFMKTKPEHLSHFQKLMHKLVETKEAKYEVKPLTFTQAIKHWIKGGEVEGWPKLWGKNGK